MKRILITVFLTLFSLTGLSAPSVVSIQHWTTAQGLPVYFVRSTSVPMVDISMVFHAGSDRDGSHFGLAKFASAEFGEGTITRGPEKIAASFDQVGAIFSAGSDRDSASVSLRCLVDPAYAKPALVSYEDALTAVSVRPKDFFRLKQQLLTAIKLTKQNPAAVANDALYAALYPSQPYGHSVLGTQHTVTAISASEVADFYHRYYTINNGLLVIVGDVTRDKAADIANTLANHLQKGKAALPIPLAADIPHAISHNIHFQAKQSSVLIGQVGINRQSPDLFPLMVANYILGGRPLTSRLFDQVREKNGLVYSIYSYFMRLPARGPFVIGFQTSADQTKHAIALVRKTLHDFLQNGPSKSALKSAKTNLIDGFVLSVASNDDILSQVSNIAYYGLPLNYLDRYAAKVQAVTKADILSALKKNIHPKAMATIIVGPTGIDQHDKSKKQANQ